jgi:hypothetical protein
MPFTHQTTRWRSLRCRALWTMGRLHLMVHTDCGTQLWINMPAKLRSTDGDERGCLFQADVHHPQRLPACAVGILEDHLQGSPSDQSVKIKYRRLPVKLPHFFDKGAVTWCAMRIGHLGYLSVHKITIIPDNNAANAPWVAASQRYTDNISKTWAITWKEQTTKEHILHDKTKGALLKTWSNRWVLRGSADVW